MRGAGDQMLSVHRGVHGETTIMCSYRYPLSTLRYKGGAQSDSALTTYADLVRHRARKIESRSFSGNEHVYKYNPEVV